MKNDEKNHPHHAKRIHTPHATQHTAQRVSKGSSMFYSPVSYSFQFCLPLQFNDSHNSFTGNAINFIFLVLNMPLFRHD